MLKMKKIRVIRKNIENVFEKFVLYIIFASM